MAEPATTAAGGALLIKLVGVPIITAAIATSLGFVFSKRPATASFH